MKRTAPPFSADPAWLRARLQEALALHQQGKLAGARARYESILATHPRQPDALHLLGLVALQSGDAATAVARISAAIAAFPGNPDFHLNLAAAHNALGRTTAALDCVDRALTLNPALPGSHLSRALLLRTLGRTPEAIASYEQALALRPDLVEGHFNLGNLLQESGHLEAAATRYAQALALQPNLVAAHVNYGAVLLQLGRPDAALPHFERALALQPALAEALAGRGNALRRLGDRLAALASYERALALQADNVEALCNQGELLLELGRADVARVSLLRAVQLAPDLAAACNSLATALLQLGQPAEALPLCERALTLQPDWADAHCNRGNAFSLLEHPSEALASYDRALALQPQHVEALHNRAVMLAKLRRVEDAAASYEQLLALQPDFEFLPGNLKLLHLTLCHWQNLDNDLARIKAGIRAGQATTPCFPLMVLADEPALLLQAAEIWARQQLSFHAELEPPPPRVPGGKIRLGYFSADFRDHPVAHLMAAIFEQHDREHFEVIGFAFGPAVNDPMRQRLERAFDRFIDVTQLGDRQVAELARELGIDIAIDLGGYTQGSRAGIFAWRAAPVQVSYIGFLGTMGVPWMDYLIADPVLIPPAQREHYTEKVACLPWYQANDRERRDSGRIFSRAELGLPERGVVLASLNNQFKISPEVFASWMRILQAVPDSVLYLVVDGDTARRNVLAEAVRRGVGRERIAFADRLPWADYLARYRVVDIFLDTWPYNAGTTASDALGMGVPLLTCPGRSLASRMAASVLQALGLPELITSSPAEYERRAVELASNPAQLATLRHRVETLRESAPLYDTVRFTRHLEAAFRAMQARRLAGLGPDDIVIAP